MQPPMQVLHTNLKPKDNSCYPATNATKGRKLATNGCFNKF
ncbi:MAG: hypothetical protein RLZZ316_715 [Bacteroidota bacterium]|jgi:hypothetical protein